LWRRGITGPRMAIDLPDIIGRDEARALGLKHFFTGKPCKRGHVAERDVSSRECVECYRQRRREWRAANLEKAKEKERKHARKYRAANPEKVRESWRRRRAANLQRNLEYHRKWWAANKDEINKRRTAQRRVARARAELIGGAGLTGAPEGNF
jgi:hypothetical protein